MSKEKIEWAIYVNKEQNNKETKVYYKDLNKVEYETKYKNNLTCSNGCLSKVKFTHRKNDVKFFSTWNGDGEKHEEGCPFHVKYKGKIGRAKLKAFYEKREINDEDVRITLLNKIKGLKRKYNGEEENKTPVNTLEVENTGEMSVPTDSNEESSGVDIEHRTRRKHNILSIDAQFLTMIDIDSSRCVYGNGSNAQICNDEGEYYGYINLGNRGYTVAVYFPKSFYSQENGISLNDFKRFLDILMVEINDNYKKNVIVCYGKIGRKNKSGVNINIINEAHIYINDMSVRQILSEGKLREVNYDIV